MKQKITLVSVLSLAGFFAIGLLFLNDSQAFTETKTGSVEASYGIDSSDNQVDFISQWLGGQSENQDLFGLFQERFLARVIEQLGTNDYNATYKFLNAAIAAKLNQDDPTSWGVILPADECAIERFGILNCLSGSGDIGRFKGNVWNQSFYLSDVPYLAYLANRPDLVSQIPGLSAYPSYGELLRIPDEVTKLKAVLEKNYPTALEVLNWKGVWGPDWLNFTVNGGGLTCSHKNEYNYNFEYDISQDNTWKPCSSTTAYKCEDIKLVFTPNAEWFACMAGGQEKSYHFKFASPPTNFISCSDQDDCLSNATEYSLTSETYGKGVQKIPADFVAQTEKSLTSSNSYMKCTDGVCVSYTSGSYPLSAVAPATSYFGQCRGYGATIDTPEVAIPAVNSNTNVTIKNRAPIPTVSFEKSSINVDETVKVTCDIVDPDECSDKIAKIKWTCTDSNGQTDNCFFQNENSSVWNQSTMSQEFSTADQANPYRAITQFKVNKSGNYAVNCEAWDNDANNPLSGIGINGIKVFDNCNADGFCNPACPVNTDSDCQGEIPYHGGYCAVLGGEDGNNEVICGEEGDAKYQAYVSGIEPAAYKWKCSSDGKIEQTDSPETTCSYKEAGSYLPALSVVDKNGKETECVTQTSTTISKDSKCHVELKNTQNSDGSYSNEVNIDQHGKVEAVVKKQCVSGGKVEWELSGGNIENQGQDSAVIRCDNAGKASIKAKIKLNDGQTIDCGGADVNINEKLQFGL